MAYSPLGRGTSWPVCVHPLICASAVGRKQPTAMLQGTKQMLVCVHPLICASARGRKQPTAMLQGAKTDAAATWGAEMGHCRTAGCKNGAPPHHGAQNQTATMLQGAETRCCAMQQRDRVSEYHVGASPALFAVQTCSWPHVRRHAHM